MQTTNCYFYHNEIDVQLNIDPTLTLRNRTVFMRTLKLYHGIDNIIRFTFKNANQQRVNITGFDVDFHMISGADGTIIVSKPATIVDAPYGVVTVTLNELDLLDCRDMYYGYSLVVTDVDTGEQHVVYSDTNYDVRGEIVLLAGHYPGFRPSINVDLPSPVRIIITSEPGQLVTTTGVVKADTPTLQQSSHHTAQFNFDNFSGKIEVQSTLDALPAPNSWATQATLIYTEQKTPTYCNWDGVFAGVRFVITPDPIPPELIPPPPAVPPSSGSVTKILYRA